MREYKELSSECTISYCPRRVTNLLLNLRSEKDNTLPTFAMKGKIPVNNPPSKENLMNFIIWNVRGVTSSSFRRQCEAMVKMHKPAILVLLETRIGEHKRLTKVLKFDSQIPSAATGLSGGIVIMWEKDLLKLSDISMTSQSIHVMVQTELTNISRSMKGDWVIWGDFSEILKASEKLGGRGINLSRVNAFQKCLDHCNMVDLGYKGRKYTWTNTREARQMFGQYLLDHEILHVSVTHIPRTKSDHCPLQLRLDNSLNSGLDNPFRLEPVWCGHPTFQNLVKSCFDSPLDLSNPINSFQKEAVEWNKNTFGNIFQKVRKILARLNGIQKFVAYPYNHFLWNLEAKLLKEYEVILKVEEDFWKTKS
ncbi:hypothetical protein KY289_024088 [Solanum tuberosum]|nr:hypothetical protein KY289_024088 [Solanum tuberosum]